MSQVINNNTPQESQDIPVAEIEVGGNILFNDTVNDIIEEDGHGNPSEIQSASYLVDRPILETEENEEPEETSSEESEEKTSETSEENSTEEAEETEETTEEAGTAYDDFSEAALYAQGFRTLAEEKGLGDLIPEEVAKDMKPEEFLDSLISGMSTKLDTIEKDIEATYGQAAEYMKILLESPDRARAEKVVTEAAGYDKYANLEITDETSDEELEAVVTSELKYKGISDRIIKSTIEDLKDTNELRGQAKVSAGYHKTLRDTLIAQEKQARESHKAQMAAQTKAQEDQFHQLVDSGSLNGLDLSKDDQKAFKRWMRDEIIVDGLDPNTGEKVRYRTTKSRQALNDFNQDFEKVLAFNKLLMDGFDFTAIKQKAKKERDSEVLNVLNNRSNSNNKTQKTKQSKNAWLGR